MDLREAILTQPMRPFQLRMIALCIVLCMIDGYEVLVMAFVAPHVARAWALGPVEVGYLLSAATTHSRLSAVSAAPKTKGARQPNSAISGLVRAPPRATPAGRPMP